MSDLDFERKHVLQAIKKVRKKGVDWLYETYPKKGGNVRKSITSFLIFEGEEFPLKPLARLARDCAGSPMYENPHTRRIRTKFRKLGFQVTESPTETSADEAKAADERQKRLAAVWQRDGQAEFRRLVLERFDNRCLVSGCGVTVVLEAAHIVPVANGGTDDVENGIPLRADLHRLFDEGQLQIDPDTWRVTVDESACNHYKKFNGRDLSSSFAGYADEEVFKRNFWRRRDFI